MKNDLDYSELKKCIGVGSGWKVSFLILNHGTIITNGSRGDLQEVLNKCIAEKDNLDDFKAHVMNDGNGLLEFRIPCVKIVPLSQIVIYTGNDPRTVPPSPWAHKCPNLIKHHIKLIRKDLEKPKVRVRNIV